MSRRRHTPEQIITALREAEVGLAKQNGGDGEPGVGDQRADVLPVEAGVRGDEGGSSSTLQGAGEGERTAKASGGEPDGGQADPGGSDQGKLLSPEADAGRDACTQRLGASERHVCHVLGQPRSTQRKKLPGDEGATHGRDTVGELPGRVSPDHGTAAYRGLGGRLRAGVSGGRRGESAQTATETGLGSTMGASAATAQVTCRLRKHEDRRRPCGSFDRARSTRGSVWRSGGRKTRAHDVLRGAHRLGRSARASTLGQGQSSRAKLVRKAGRCWVQTLCAAGCETATNESFNGKLRSELLERRVGHTVRGNGTRRGGGGCTIPSDPIVPTADYPPPRDDKTIALEEPQLQGPPMAASNIEKWRNWGHLSTI